MKSARKPVPHATHQRTRNALDSTLITVRELNERIVALKHDLANERAANRMLEDNHQALKDELERYTSGTGEQPMGTGSRVFWRNSADSFLPGRITATSHCDDGTHVLHVMIPGGATVALLTDQLSFRNDPLHTCSVDADVPRVAPRL